MYLTAEDKHRLGLAVLHRDHYNQHCCIVAGRMEMLLGGKIARLELEDSN